MGQESRFLAELWERMAPEPACVEAFDIAAAAVPVAGVAVVPVAGVAAVPVGVAEKYATKYVLTEITIQLDLRHLYKFLVNPPF